MESWVKEGLRQTEHIMTGETSLHKIWMKNESGRIRTFLNSLEILEGVPLAYLIPQGGMLPPESIRFFYLDRNWTEALKDGAMSIGRNCTRDRAHDKMLMGQMRESAGRSDGESIYTGFFLRSMLVSGWNDMIVSCTGTDGKEIPVIQRKILAKEVLLVIAEGKIAEAELTEPLETVSFGVEEGAEGPQVEVDIPGCANKQVQVIQVPMKDAEKRTLNVPALAGAIQNALNESGTSGESVKSAIYAATLTRRQKSAVIQADWR